MYEKEKKEGKGLNKTQDASRFILVLCFLSFSLCEELWLPAALIMGEVDQ